MDLIFFYLPRKLYTTQYHFFNFGVKFCFFVIVQSAKMCYASQQPIGFLLQPCILMDERRILTGCCELLYVCAICTLRLNKLYVVDGSNLASTATKALIQLTTNSKKKKEIFHFIMPLNNTLKDCHFDISNAIMVCFR